MFIQKGDFGKYFIIFSMVNINLETQIKSSPHYRN